MSVITEIATERRRQVAVEGWNSTHDDDHSDGALAKAAACYAVGEKLSCWPFDEEWWKPKDGRRNLIRAAALIVAEIERMDRLMRKP